MTCPYFGVCGGCQNQHLSYAQQLDNKKHRVEYLLRPFYQKEIKIVSKEPFGYRNRMEFVVTAKTIGFRQVDERKIIDIKECPISEPRINAILTEVRSWLGSGDIEPFDKSRKSGIIKYFVIRAAQDTSVSFVLNEDSSKIAAAVENLRTYAQQSLADNVIVAYTPAASDEATSSECFAIKGEEFLKSNICGKTLYFHSQGFFQNNTLMAQELVQFVKEQCVNHDSEKVTVVDAYGGVGTFGIVLSDVCQKVISIENYPAASEAAAKNILANEAQNVTVINADASTIGKIEIEGECIYVLDPPRSGMDDKVLRHIMQRKPKTVIYVSCNPSQLAKELTQLTQKYSVESVTLFDLFPQTNHVEAVAVLNLIQ